MDLLQTEEFFRTRRAGPMDAAGSFAVLVPLVREQGGLSLLYEVRSRTMRRQPGEICFPGGRMEGAESPEECALRETWEEIGVPPSEVEILAPLDVIQDISDRVIYPFLGRISPAAAARLKASQAEVKNVFFVPLDFLRTCPEEVYRYRVRAQVDDSFPYDRIGFPHDYPWRSGWMDVPIYEYQGHFIWGMTGRTVRWLLTHLNRLEEQLGE